MEIMWAAIDCFDFKGTGLESTASGYISYLHIIGN